MKKIPRPTKTATVHGIRLFRQDLEHIFQTMREHSLEVQISDADYIYDAIDEVLEQRGPRPSALILRGTPVEEESAHFSQTEFVVTFRGQKATIEARNLATLWLEIRKYVQRQVPWYFYPSLPMVAFLVFLIGLHISSLQIPDLLFLEALFQDSSVLREIPRSAYLWFLASGIIFLTSVLFHHYHFRVFLWNRHEGGFWKRNADRLWMLIIGFVLGLFAEGLRRLLQ